MTRDRTRAKASASEGLEDEEGTARPTAGCGMHLKFASEEKGERKQGSYIGTAATGRLWSTSSWKRRRKRRACYRPASPRCLRTGHTARSPTLGTVLRGMRRPPIGAQAGTRRLQPARAPIMPITSAMGPGGDPASRALTTLGPSSVWRSQVPRGICTALLRRLMGGRLSSSGVVSPHQQSRRPVYHGVSLYIMISHRGGVKA